MDWRNDRPMGRLQPVARLVAVLRSTMPTKLASGLGWALAGLGVGAAVSCQHNPPAASASTRATQPNSDAPVWTPVNAGINPAYHRWQSRIGLLTVHERPEPSHGLNDPKLRDLLALQTVQFRQSMVQAGMQVALLPQAGRVRLGDQPFERVVLRATAADGTPVEQQHLFGVMAGHVVQVTLELNTHLDAAQDRVLLSSVAEAMGAIMPFTAARPVP